MKSMTSSRSNIIIINIVLAVQMVAILFFAIDYTYRAKINRLYTVIQSMDKALIEKHQIYEENFQVIKQVFIQQGVLKNESTQIQKPSNEAIDNSGDSSTKGETKEKTKDGTKEK